MKFTLSWLKQHLDTDAPIAAIADRLTMLGLEVEKITDPAAKLAGFIVGYVEKAEQHPNADRLRVCLVDTGSAKLQVVCGAPNARTGMKGVFAPAGSVIPASGLVLKKTAIRGSDSNGMLCSARELELGEDHDGIIELPANAKVGSPAAAALGVDDPVIEIKLTPNRGDCLGVHGIARDLAASGLGKLKPLKAEKIAGGFKSPIAWKRDLTGDYANACPLVVGRYFRNVKNGPSPEWLQRRLKAIGLRPISALVDITNLVTFDLGRPLHVFDADKLKGDLTMRMARAGEKILALDGKEYALDGETTVIADASQVHGIGGIMGGEHSGCSAETRNVFLEAAFFDPVRVAASGRKLGIQSDARYRFERGIDPQSCLWGAEVAARLILELCGGEASELTQAGEVPKWQRSYALRPSRIQGLGGIDVGAAKTEAILAALGFAVSKGESWTVTPPSWRSDIIGEADLVEEVLRVHGFDNIPATSMPRLAAMPSPAITTAQRRLGTVRRALAARGMNEAVTWSFMDRDIATLFGGVPESLALLNPIASDLSVMRPSIIANLLQAASRNMARGQINPALFEVGPVYRGIEPKDQSWVAAGVRCGDARPRHWREPPRAVEAIDAKADALALLALLDVDPASLNSAAEAPAWYHPGRSGALRQGTRPVAYFGEIHPTVLARLEIAGPAAGFELLLDQLPQRKARATRARPKLVVSAFQPVRRDLAFIVAENVPAEALIKAARGAERTLIVEVEIFDVYAGKGIAAGHKSVAISLLVQPQARTLTDAEIDALCAKVVADVAKATGGSLRT